MTTKEIHEEIMSIVRSLTVDELTRRSIDLKLTILTTLAERNALAEFMGRMQAKQETQ